MNDNHVLGFNDPVLGAESGNVFEAGLTPQQREELTVAAQNGLRLVAFQKIHELLGIDMIKQVAVDNRSNSNPNAPTENKPNIQSNDPIEMQQIN